VACSGLQKRQEGVNAAQLPIIVAFGKRPGVEGLVL